MKKLLIASMLLLIGSPVFFSVDVYGQEKHPQTMNRVELNEKDLPQAVRTALGGEEYEGWRIDKVYKVDNSGSEKSVGHYNIRLQNGKEFKDVYLDGEGKVYEPQPMEKDMKDKK